MRVVQPGPIAPAERSLATSFNASAADYARLRPGYPAAAVDIAVPTGSSRVLDLGAGTGKLTGSLLGQVPTVFAVEPLLGMLGKLHALFPGARAIAGSAEAIPLRASTVDAVTVGQAFHWFDTGPALDEISRVLRPGGVLSLLWNHDDETDPLFRDIQDALGRAGRPRGGSTQRAADTSGPEHHLEQEHQRQQEPEPQQSAPQPEQERAADHDPDGRQQQAPSAEPSNADLAKAAAGQRPRGSTNPPFTGHRSFTDPVLTEIGWRRTQSADDLVGLLGTYSYVIRATDEIRDRLAREVRAIIEHHRDPALDADQPVVIPVYCQVWQSTCR